MFSVLFFNGPAFDAQFFWFAVFGRFIITDAHEHFANQSLFFPFIANTSAIHTHTQRKTRHLPCQNGTVCDGAILASKLLENAHSSIFRLFLKKLFESSYLALNTDAMIWKVIWLAEQNEWKWPTLDCCFLLRFFSDCRLLPCNRSINKMYNRCLVWYSSAVRAAEMRTRSHAR